MTGAWIVDAVRTAVAPRQGAHALMQANDLASEVIKALVARELADIDGRIEVILGNGLYGGGNPARVAALQAGLAPVSPAFTLDTQCCSGLDAIAFAAARISSGCADIVLAGGVESYSRSPLRFWRPLDASQAPIFYARPPFTPWPDQDPDLIVAAADLAAELKITRGAQEEYAIESHRKAISKSSMSAEIVCVNGLREDSFSRRLSQKICSRLSAIAGHTPFDLTAATIAVEADAAAVLLLASEKYLNRLSRLHHPVRIVGSNTGGFDPSRPALAPIEPARQALRAHSTSVESLAVVEIMEAFAVQAMAFLSIMGVNPAIANRRGGALARGHPIGASGAILAVRLFHELQMEANRARGLAAIAAAGGLGSALLLERA